MSKKPILMFLAKKVSLLVITYFIAICVVFVLPRLIPASPLAVKMQSILQMYILKPEMVPRVWHELIKTFELDKPWYVQFITFVTRAFGGDLGVSIERYPMKVNDIIARALPWTLVLVIPPTIVSWFVGNIIGAYAGYKRGRMLEKFVLGYSFIVSRIPYYWLAMLMLFTLGFRLRWFPIGGKHSIWVTPSPTLDFFVDFLWHYTLPFLSMFIIQSAGWMGSMRVVISGELGSDYIAYSESLGVRDGIIFKYAYRNSLLPQVTGLALQLGFALTGALVTENVFNYQGLGYYLASAIGALDYPVIQGIFLIVIATVFLANFLVDFMYALIDPRIRVGGEKV
ncbi:MAG: ABC transporter permease [Ignisphaera sp.]|uniref:ABC transporter permease n=1 Tax=Ignisphaera aggregans TaxID=334771 RepID=A0A7C4JKP4_9CREN